MILSGREVLARRLVRNLIRETTQRQPCGVDLSLRAVYQWQDGATLGFDNLHRRSGKPRELPFKPGTQTFELPPGTYLVDFNETVRVPRDCMASIFPRSSLWRSGVTVSAGVVDADYEGAMGALLQVGNPHGIQLMRDARLAQIVFQQMAEEVEGYAGVYQASTSSVGRDGAEGGGPVGRESEGTEN